MRSSDDRLRSSAALAPAVVTIALLFGGALLGTVRTSLVPVPGAGLGDATLEVWVATLRDPAFVDAALFTLRTTALATLISAVLAILAALALRREGPALRSLFALPVPVPHLLVAVAAVVWLAPGGLAERALEGLPIELVRDEAGLGIVLVYVYKELPFLVMLSLAVMGSGLRRREEAAAVLGAGPWQRARWIVWPALRAPVTLGSLIVAAFVAGAFEVPLAIGPNYPPTLATYALEATQTAALEGQSRAAAALLVAFAASAGLAMAATRLLQGKHG